MNWAIAAASIFASLSQISHPSPGSAQSAAVDVRPWIGQVVNPKVHLLAAPDDYLGPAVGNVSIIEQSDGFVVIDSGLTVANGRAIVAHIRSRSSKPIKAVAITHWHNDHPQGVSAIRDAWPRVRIIASRKTEEGMLGPEAVAVGYRPDPLIDAEMKKLVDGAKSGYQKLVDDPSTAPDRRLRAQKALREFDEFFTGYPGTYIVPPTETFERELVLKDRDVPVHLRFLGRANTEGDIIAWLPKQRVVITGDIVVSPIPFGFYSSPSDWPKVLGQIKALPFATLIPGHGKPQVDRLYLDRLIGAIDEVRAQVTPLARAGLPIDEVRKKVDFTKAAEAFGDTPRARANAQALFFDPLVASAYKEVLGQAIIQGENTPAPAYRHDPPRPQSRKHRT